MKRIGVSLLWGMFLIGWGGNPGHQAAAEATAGGPPQRIISLAPSLTEILFALGLGNQVVGVTDFCDYPEEAQRKPKVGGYVSPSLEAIIALRPQLVLAVPDLTNQPLLERLSQLGIRVLGHKARNLQDIWSTIEAIGWTTATQTRAQNLVSEMQERVDRIQKITRKALRVRVLFVFSYDPLVVAGGETFFDELIRLAGGINVAGDSRVQYPKYSLEEVLRRDPEVIFLPGRMGADLPAAGDSARSWKHWPGLSAVRQGRIYKANDTSLIRPGPRIVQGLEALARVLHPELLLRDAKRTLQDVRP